MSRYLAAYSRTAFEELAKTLSPGMAAVLERLVAGYLTGQRPNFTQEEHGLLMCAAMALSAVNRTPGAAKDIGDKADGGAHNGTQSKRIFTGAQVFRGYLT